MTKGSAFFVFLIGMAATFSSLWAVTKNAVPEYGLALAVLVPTAVVAYVAKSGREVLRLAVVVVLSCLVGYAAFWISLRYVASHI